MSDKITSLCQEVVTQESFRQIQCDLGYLLEIEEEANYPWAVFIDDLETFLITLKRKKQSSEELKQFLSAWEKLQERVICYDELELLCAYFLFNRANFINTCNRKEVFISQPDTNLLFDNLYQVGFGFKDELNLKNKLKRKSAVAAAIIKKNKLRQADTYETG